MRLERPPFLTLDLPGLLGGVRGGNIVNTVPFTLVVDREGNIVHRQFGEFSKARLLQVLTPLFD